MVRLKVIENRLEIKFGKIISLGVELPCKALSDIIVVGKICKLQTFKIIKSSIDVVK